MFLEGLALEDSSQRKKLREALERLAREGKVYLTGGALRDLFLNRKVKDLDLLVLDYPPEEVARRLSRELSWTLVPLHEEIGVFRVTRGGFSVDISGLRPGAAGLEEDLRLRDFTFNALAVSLSEALREPPERWRVIDPTGGREDLSRGRIRVISEENLREDPLRIIRAYRFVAQGYGEIEARTREAVRRVVRELADREFFGVAPERIQAELYLILASGWAARAFSLMEEDGVLGAVIPELEEGRGVPQPDFHHLDVLGHALETLARVEDLLADPARYFRDTEVFSGLRDSEEDRVTVKLAALFHDAGKARTFAPPGERADRITFYEHERVGAEMFEAWATRLRWKRALIRRIRNLIRHHMRPFFLLELYLKGELTVRARRRLVRDCPEYPLLFLLALADALAARGPASEESYPERLVELFEDIHRFAREVFDSVVRERLVTGHDLIEIFGLKPGPVFREILSALEEARMEGKVKTRAEALEWIRNYLRDHPPKEGI